MQPYRKAGKSLLGYLPGWQGACKPVECGELGVWRDSKFQLTIEPPVSTKMYREAKWFIQSNTLVCLSTPKFLAEVEAESPA
jgi:hypothetical protein